MTLHCKSIKVHEPSSSLALALESNILVLTVEKPPASLHLQLHIQLNACDRLIICMNINMAAPDRLILSLSGEARLGLHKLQGHTFL